MSTEENDEVLHVHTKTAFELDATPMAVASTCRLLRKHARKLQRQDEKKPFTPAPGKTNLTHVKVNNFLDIAWDLEEQLPERLQIWARGE